MTIEELEKFIEEQDALFRSKGAANQSERERVYARTIKLGEEYGELCDAVLATAGDQRKNKLADGVDLEGEFADVVIVAFLLAKSMNVDMKKALSEKIAKIRTKHNTQL